MDGTKFINPDVCVKSNCEYCKKQVMIEYGSVPLCKIICKKGIFTAESNFSGGRSESIEGHSRVSMRKVTYNSDGEKCCNYAIHVAAYKEDKGSAHSSNGKKSRNLLPISSSPSTDVLGDWWYGKKG